MLLGVDADQTRRRTLFLLRNTTNCPMAAPRLELLSCLKVFLRYSDNTQQNDRGSELAMMNVRVEIPHEAQANGQAIPLIIRRPSPGWTRGAVAGMRRAFKVSPAPLEICSGAQAAIIEHVSMPAL